MLVNLFGRRCKLPFLCALIDLFLRGSLDKAVTWRRIGKSYIIYKYIKCLVNLVLFQDINPLGEYHWRFMSWLILID